MCGIAAIFSVKDPVSSENLQNANLVQIHRGPDNQSFWIDPHGIAGLAHARLSLLDLTENGDQPLTWKGNGTRERLKLVHNGEFYDFERIKKELEKRGHHFHTASDSEILLPLYQEFGTAALSQLRGEFAFVLWDRDNRLVFAARDRFGIKPLYYTIYQERLYFASEVKALFAMGVPAVWDREMFHQFHATWLMTHHRTLYQNIFQIPPAHYLLATANEGFNNLKLTSYWDFDYPTAERTENKKFNLEEEVLQFREKLQEAVRLRLRADVPVASYLSGGLDSCSILGIAARETSVPIHSFTVCFVEDAEYNEGQVAREMAQFCNAIHHELPMKQADLWEHLGDALWQAETPFMNTHGIAKYLLSKSVRDAGFKAVLTGEGSDEIVAGYAHFRKDFLNHHYFLPDKDKKFARLAETNQISKGLLLATETDPALATVRDTLGYVPSFLESFAKGGRRSLSLMKGDFDRFFKERDSWKIWLNDVDISRQLSGRARLNQSLYLESRTLLPGYLLTVLGDRMEMAHSIEGRVPFLDHKLVEHAVQLPIGLKIGNDLSEKYILKEAARPFVTETVYSRQKHPFLAPSWVDSTDSKFFDYAQDVFRSKSSAEHPFYDQEKIIQLLDRIPKMTADERSGLDIVLMVALSTIVMQQRFRLSSN